MITNFALIPLLMIVGVAATAEQVEYLNPQSFPADHRLAKRMDLEVCIGESHICPKIRAIESCHIKIFL